MPLHRADEARPLEGTPYDLVRLLGKGSMGEVYEALHRTLRKRRAIKILAAHLVHRPDLAERMRVEAQLLASIRHPNLVEVVDLGVSSDGRLYFVMDLLEGHTLRGTIEANAPMRPALALELMIPILDGLEAAHAAGVVHRDVKPENVFVLATGEVRVLDFGVAKVGQTAATLTKTSFTAGTPRYMAPEQVDGRPSDPRTDVFACGSVLYELLTGHGPFDRDDRMALAFAILTSDPAPVSSAHPISDRLRRAVARALAKDPAARFPSASAMAEELRACLAEADSTATGLPSTTVVMPPAGIAITPITNATGATPVVRPGDRRRGWGGVAVMAVVVLAIVAGAVGWWAARPRAGARASTSTSTATSTATTTTTSTTTSTATSTSTSTATSTSTSTSTATSTSTTAATSTSTSTTTSTATSTSTSTSTSTLRHSAPNPSLGPEVPDAGPRRPGSGL